MNDNLSKRQEDLIINLSYIKEEVIDSLKSIFIVESDIKKYLNSFDTLSNALVNDLQDEMITKICLHDANAKLDYSGNDDYMDIDIYIILVNGEEFLLNTFKTSNEDEQ